MKFTPLAALAALFLIPGTGWGHHLDSEGLTHAQIEQLSANPKTAADHQKLVKQFTMEAVAYDQEATEFEAIGLSSKGNATLVEACKSGAELARKLASVNRSMAAEHEAMAKKT